MVTMTFTYTEYMCLQIHSYEGARPGSANQEKNQIKKNWMQISVAEATAVMSLEQATRFSVFRTQPVGLWV